MTYSQRALSVKDMFAYSVELVIEGMTSQRRDDPIWLNEMAMTLDRIAYRACAEAGVQAIAEEFRLDMAEAQEISRREVARLQTEIALLRERQEILAQRQLEIDRTSEALKERLERLAADIEAFYVRYGYERQGNEWIRKPTPPNPISLLEMLFNPQNRNTPPHRPGTASSNGPSPGGV